VLAPDGRAPELGAEHARPPAPVAWSAARPPGRTRSLEHRLAPRLERRPALAPARQSPATVPACRRLLFFLPASSAATAPTVRHGRHLAAGASGGEELDLGTGKLDSAVGKVDSEAGKLDSGAGRLDLGSCELEKKAGGGQRAREGQRALLLHTLLEETGSGCRTLATVRDLNR